LQNWLDSETGQVVRTNMVIFSPKFQPLLWVLPFASF
jgi:hypothetical protein